MACALGGPGERRLYCNEEGGANSQGGPLRNFEGEKGWEKELGGRREHLVRRWPVLGVSG